MAWLVILRDSEEEEEEELPYLPAIYVLVVGRGDLCFWIIY